MKKIGFSLFMLMQVFSLQAQVQELGVSKYFETTYPEDVALLPLSNHNTMLIRFHESNKLNVQIYDATRNEIVQVKGKLPVEKLKNVSFYGLRELDNGNVTFFCMLPEQGSDRVIYNVIINGQSGLMESCTEVERFSRKQFGMLAAYTDGLSIATATSDNKKYTALYFKNFNAQQSEMKQQVWIIDRVGNVIEKAGINQDKEGKYPKGLGMIGIDIADDGTVYMITTNYKNDKEMKRYFIKKELQKAAKVSRLCGAAGKYDFFSGNLKYNPVKNEVVYVNYKNYKVRIDSSGACSTELLAFPELKQLQSDYIKTRNSDKFYFQVGNIEVEPDGSYTYSLALLMDRMESHHNNMQMPYTYTTGYGTWNSGKGGFSFVPTFIRGHAFSSSVGSAGFGTLKYDDVGYYVLARKEGAQYLLFNDNEDSRNKLEESDRLKRIQNKKNVSGFYAMAGSEKLPKVAPVISSNNEYSYYYWGTAVKNEKGELVVIKLLDGDKMQVAWLQL